GQQLVLALSEVQGHLDVLEALEKVRSGPAPAGGDPAGALVYSAVGSGEADGAAPAGRAEQVNEMTIDNSRRCFYNRPNATIEKRVDLVDAAMRLLSRAAEGLAR